MMGNRMKRRKKDKEKKRENECTKLYCIGLAEENGRHNYVTEDSSQHPLPPTSTDARGTNTQKTKLVFL